MTDELTTSIQPGDTDVSQYAMSELAGVRVMLYRNPEGGWISVHVETDTDEAHADLRVMLNDADLYEGDTAADKAQQRYAAYRVPLQPHPEHDECADGCGLDVTHDGACLDKPGGRQVCEHEEPDGAPVEQWEVTTPADVYLKEEDL